MKRWVAIIVLAGALVAAVGQLQRDRERIEDLELGAAVAIPALESCSVAMAQCASLQRERDLYVTALESCHRRELY